MDKGIIFNDNRGKEKAPEPIIDISPKVVSDEEIAQFKDLDKEIARIKSVFKMAQDNAVGSLAEVAKKQRVVWEKLAEKYSFDMNDPWQVNYEDKVIIPGVAKVQGK
jgi:hypothetical protein